VYFSAKTCILALSNFLEKGKTMTPELFAEIHSAESMSNNEEQFLDNLSLSKNELVRRFVARNKNATKKILLRLAKDSSVRVREDVSLNENLDAELFEILARDESKVVKMNIAPCYASSGKVRISPEILAYLSEDTDDVVRSSVADNPYAPKEVLDILADDPSWNVRWGVAMNSNTAKETIWRMGRDTIVNDFMEVLAQRNDMPASFLELLLDKPGIRSDDVYRTIIRNQNVSIKILDRISGLEDVSPEILCLALERKFELEKNPKLFEV
jgi:hypothetical protein